MTRVRFGGSYRRGTRTTKETEENRVSSDPGWLHYLLLSSHLEKEKKTKTGKSETLGEEKREKRNLEGDGPPNRNAQERKATKAIPKEDGLILPSQ